MVLIIVILLSPIGFVTNESFSKESMEKLNPLTTPHSSSHGSFSDLSEPPMFIDDSIRTHFFPTPKGKEDKELNSFMTLCEKNTSTSTSHGSPQSPPKYSPQHRDHVLFTNTKTPLDTAPPSQKKIKNHLFLKKTVLKEKKEPLLLRDEKCQTRFHKYPFFSKDTSPLNFASKTSKTNSFPLTSPVLKKGVHPFSPKKD